MDIVILAQIFLLPAITLIWFLVSLVRFSRLKKMSGAVSEAQWKSRRRGLIYSAIVAGVINGALLVLMVLFSMAIFGM